MGLRRVNGKVVTPNSDKVILNNRVAEDSVKDEKPEITYSDIM